MATRSRIGMEMADGSVKSIYCHWDGYVSHNGAILMEHYTDHKKVESLIELGAISSLNEKVSPEGEEHSFNSPQEGVTVAYHRDRGEEKIPARIDGSVPDFFNSDIEEYGYLFTQEGEWLVQSANRRGIDPMTVRNFILIS